MADQVMTIRIRTKADGTVEIENVAKGLDKIGREAGDASKGLQDVSASAGGLSGAFGTAARAASALFAAIAVKEIVGGMATLVRTGIEYNSTLEQNRLGMASLVSAFGEIVDANGQRLEGEAAWQASLAISEEMQDRLRIKALQTTAEFEDLVQALQFSIGPALQAAFDPEQIVDFTTAVAQSAAAIGVPMQQLGQEIRALFQGDIGPDSRLAQMFFAGEKNVRAFVQELKDSGQFYDYMMQKMAAFTRAGEEMAGTFSGALSNLKDAFTQALGAATQDAMSDSTSQLRELTDLIVIFDEEENAVFNENFIRAIDGLASAFIRLGQAGVDGLQKLDRMLDKWEDYKELVRRRNEDPFGTLGLNLDDVTRQREAREAGEAARESERLQRSGRYGLMEAGLVGRDGSLVGSSSALSGFATDEVGAQLAGMERLYTAAAEFEEQGKEEYDRYLAALKKFAADGIVTLKEFKAAREDALGGDKGGASVRAKERQQREVEQLAGVRENYFREWSDFEREATAAGDPLAEAFAKIEKDRAARLAKINDALKKGMISQAEAVKQTGAANAIFDEEAQRAAEEDWQRLMTSIDKATAETFKAVGESEKQWAEDSAALMEIRNAITADAEAERIALITDAIEQERQERLLAVEEWAAAEKAAAASSIQDAEMRADAIAEIEQERARRTEAINARAAQKQQQQIAGSIEWVKKWNAEIAGQFQSTADMIGSALVDSVGALRSAFDEGFQDLFSGDGDLTDVFDSFTKNMQKIWSQRISDMFAKAIVDGESLTKQLKGLWGAMGAVGEDGKPAYMDRALAGAGVGSMVGGMFGREGTYGDVGGMLGGALGGIMGPLGGVLGSLFGTILGSLIEKSQDWVKVAITDGVVSVTEKGIDKEARLEMAEEIRSQLGDLEDQYEDILNLFPEEVRARITAAIGKVNAGDEVKGEDITNDQALLLFTDFLSEELPAAVFDAYSGAIGEGLELMGVESEKIQELMAYWGSLQGEELREAVYRYIEVLADTAELQNMYGGTFEGLMGEARRRSSMTAFDPIAELNAEMAAATAELATLDIEDQAAAVARINEMRRQGLEMEIQLLQAIDATQKALLEQGQNFRDQIEFQRLGDDVQAQVDFYEKKFNETMVAMKAATDPAEIQRLYQEAMGYMQSAFGLAPDDAQLQEDLLTSSELLDRTMEERMAEARDEVRELELEAGNTLLEAGEVLLQAGELLGGGTPGAPNPNPPPDEENKQPGIPEDQVGANSIQVTVNPVIEFSGEIAGLMNLIELTAQRASAEMGKVIIGRIKHDKDLASGYLG